MADLRGFLRNNLPFGLRTKLSAMMEKPGIETVVLNDNRFTPDTTARPRINLIIPSLTKGMAFGGVTTGLQFFCAMAAGLKASHDIDIRVITEDAYSPSDSALETPVRTAGLNPDQIEVLSLRSNALTIPTRARDIFMAYNWWISLNIEAVLKAQAAHFAQAPLPKLYIIQEYEPLFHSYSSAHMLALHAFNPSWPMWAVFNSSELANHYVDQGNTCTRSYVFEPWLDPRIKAYLDGITPEGKTRTVLVYGRPNIKRNCFSIVQDGLRIWAREHGAGSDWRIVSAGTKHDDIDLGGGHKLHSLGKLSLEDYGKLMRETAIGISLMASPHPSYPPLEMAHFGARVISNRYPNKDLGTRHENIISLDDMRPATLARTLAETMTAFEADPGAGLTAKSFMPSYLSDTPFACLEAFTHDVAELITGVRDAHAKVAS